MEIIFCRKMERRVFHELEIWDFTMKWALLSFCYEKEIEMLPWNGDWDFAKKWRSRLAIKRRLIFWLNFGDRHQGLLFFCRRSNGLCKRSKGLCKRRNGLNAGYWSKMIGQVCVGHLGWGDTIAARAVSVGEDVACRSANPRQNAIESKVLHQNVNRHEVVAGLVNQARRWIALTAFRPCHTKENSL